MRRQAGLTTVEFAIVGGLFLVTLFGVIEFARAVFVWNTMTEATRRGARVAAVCPVNHANVAQYAIFGTPGGGAQSPVLPDLTTANVVTRYLDANGGETAIYLDIRFVQVSMQNYTHRLLIPLPLADLQLPPFTTTLPAESLGYNPDTGARECP